MRIAWFRAARHEPAGLLDETAPIIASLSQQHHLEIITAAEADDFVWQHFRQPFDVCVYELGNTPAHRFMRAYLPHYPGIVAEPGRGVDPPKAQGSSLKAQSPKPEGRRLTIGLPDSSRRTVAEATVRRAREAGVDVSIVEGDAAAALDADVVVALEWPPRRGAPTAALLGMAVGKTVVTLEVEATAGWSALDPQTWQPRGWLTDPPIVVSLDPRDEEHSLLLTIKRLAADAALRAALAAAGHDWWRQHATLEHGVAAWNRIPQEAAATPQAPRGADHTTGLRATLRRFGVDVDTLDFSLRSSVSGHDRSQ